MVRTEDERSDKIVVLRSLTWGNEPPLAGVV